MTSEPKRNLPASVRQRLLTLSERRKEPFDLVLVRYGIERLLYRLSRSPHAEKFLLKGAMLFAIWSDGTHRPTRDVDLLGSGPHDDETLKTIFTELCRLETEPDGLTFLPESVAAVPIREEAAYPGTRVTLEADWKAPGFGCRWTSGSVMSSRPRRKKLHSRHCWTFPPRICGRIRFIPSWPRNSKRAFACVRRTPG